MNKAIRLVVRPTPSSSLLECRDKLVVDVVKNASIFQQREGELVYHIMEIMLWLYLKFPSWADDMLELSISGGCFYVGIIILKLYAKDSFEIMMFRQ